MNAEEVQKFIEDGVKAKAKYAVCSFDVRFRETENTSWSKNYTYSNTQHFLQVTYNAYLGRGETKKIHLNGHDMVKRDKKIQEVIDWLVERNDGKVEGEIATKKHREKIIRDTKKELGYLGIEAHTDASGLTGKLPNGIYVSGGIGGDIRLGIYCNNRKELVKKILEFVSALEVE